MARDWLFGLMTVAMGNLAYPEPALAGQNIWDPSPTTVPDYVVAHAPLVYLYSEEKYMPGSISRYLDHFWMSTAIQNVTAPVQLSNLTAAGRELRDMVGSADEPLYLSSHDRWDNDPEWVTASSNIPSRCDGYISEAPATLILVDKGEFLDAFWFFFYPFNEGPYIMGRGPVGNHLGDWEHALVRFKRGKTVPELLWMSAHGGGTAYKWTGLPDVSYKTGRKAIFAARGTHANYISVGQHSHDIPWHMLSDFSDRGDLWDPAKNYVAYTFNGTVVRPANGSVEGREHEFGDWLLFDGCWGDKQLQPNDPRQGWSPWQWKMIDGPQGPLFKTLLRSKPCERHKWWNVFGVCRIRRRVTPGEGSEAELLPCPRVLELFPTWLRPPVSLLVRGGYLCFLLDLFWA